MKRFPFIRAGLILAISPILLAFITSLFQGGSMWDEGSGTGGYIWFMFLTLPVGFLLIVIGLAMVVLRGVAFREKTMHEAAIECFKRALMQKKMPEALAHRALFERGVTYGLMGKKAMGIKDLEKILVDNPDNPEVEKKLAELKK